MRSLLPFALFAALLPAAERPNILFILVDDLRFDDLGATGHPFVRTPHLDRIAREGARFRNAFVTTPLCSPSRASFLTGLYAHHHGVIDNTARDALSHRLKTFPQQLQRAGYETGYIGKWHMGNDETRRPGFDYWVSFKGQGRYLDPELHENGKTARAPGYVTDIFTDRTVSFIERSRTKPFFLYLAHKAVHPDITQRDDGSLEGEEVFRPAERHKDLYSNEPISRRPNYGRPPADKPALLRVFDNLPPLGPATVTGDDIIRGRLRMLMAVEDGMARIFQALEKAGQLDNTLILLAGDNGFFYGEHGLSQERRLAYEESARIPLIARYPRLIRPGRVIESIALNIDLAPTVLELAGAPPLEKTDGRSLAPLFSGDGKPWRDSFLIECFSDRVFPRIRNMGYQAVRTERWKYIRYTELDGMDELYDLQSDPYELNNLIHQPQSRTMLERLRETLRQLAPPSVTLR
ncbi:MAG: sulfatase [Acidobacteria bacterium]|nr:sulfatase [Acidobacteriota bacterium]